MKGGFFDKYAGSIPSIYVLSSSCYMNLISNVMMDIYSMQRQAYFSVHKFLKVLVVQIRRSISILAAMFLERCLFCWIRLLAHCLLQKKTEIHDMNIVQYTVLGHNELFVHKAHVVEMLTELLYGTQLCKSARRYLMLLRRVIRTRLLPTNFRVAWTHI